MKRKRTSDERIISILKEHEAGMKVQDLARKYGVSEQSIYRWRAKFGGMEVSEAKRLKAMVAGLSLDKQMLEDVLSREPKATHGRPVLPSRLLALRQLHAVERRR